MDTNIGAKERVTQERLIGLFQNVLKYDYLGNWEYREDNANVEEALLRRYLKRRSYADKEIDKAVAKLKQAAANIGIGLLLSFSYILFSTVTSTFAVSGATSPLLAMWIPNIIYTVIAVVLYKKAPK